MAINKVCSPEEKQTIEVGIIGGPFDRIKTVLEEFEPGQEENGSERNYLHEGWLQS